MKLNLQHLSYSVVCLQLSRCTHQGRKSTKIRMLSQLNLRNQSDRFIFVLYTVFDAVCWSW